VYQSVLRRLLTGGRAGGRSVGTIATTPQEEGRGRRAKNFTDTLKAVLVSGDGTSGETLNPKRRNCRQPMAKGSAKERAGGEDFY